MKDCQKVRFVTVTQLPVGPDILAHGRASRITLAWMDIGYVKRSGYRERGIDKRCDKLNVWIPNISL